MKEFWNNRYSDEAFAYGESPNEFFKQQILQFPPGKILLPAEGEGRNAVFAAQLGWQVSAFDQSEAGKTKAEQLASKHQVRTEYRIGEFLEVSYEKNSFDCIGLIYAHFPVAYKSSYHQLLDSYLKPGGIIILEGFSKSHLQFSAVNPQAGGPKNVDLLFSTEEIKNDFPNYEVLELAEVEVDLQEGAYHNGQSSVIRFVGRKK